MFRFTIRDVLWLTVLVALGVGWAVDSRQRRVAYSKLNEELVSTRLERTERHIRMRQLEWYLERKSIPLPASYERIPSIYD